MNWTAASAIATWVGDALIVGTVFVALVQLKNGQQAMQFDATRNLIARSLDPDFYRALRLSSKNWKRAWPMMPMPMSSPKQAAGTSMRSGDIAGLDHLPVLSFLGEHFVEERLCSGEWGV